MMTSRVMPLTLSVRSSNLALPSGFRVALSKSKKASAAKLTFSVAGATGTTGAGAGAGAGAAGAATGAGAAGAGTPSQPCTPVAGVQPLSRQQYSFEPFFQTVPSVARQLSTF